MLLPPASGTYSEMGAIFQVAISFSIQRKLGGKTKKKYEFISRNGIQFPRFLFSFLDESIYFGPFSFSFSSAPSDIQEPNSGMDQGSKHLQVIKHDLSFKPVSITSKS